MAKVAKPYSKNCNQLNSKPYIHATNKPVAACSLKPPNKALCAQTVQTPEDNKITVLANGKCHGFKTSIPFGGQIQPKPTAGEVLTWKNVQKNEKKNITSDVINKIIP